MRLIVVHYHLRPGGIRRVIELATPFLVRELGVTEVVVATGELANREWAEHFAGQLAPTSTRFFVRRVFHYVSEQKTAPATIKNRLNKALDDLLAGCTADHCVVWAHNLGIGRNLLLAQALTRACRTRKLPLLLHHHDWWFDNRWRRWQEMRASGFRSVASIARTAFPSRGRVCHIAINRSDARTLQRHFPKRSGWLPNLTQPFPKVDPERLKAAENWLRQHLPDPAAPMWLLPARVLRRKNVAEALLLTRWLRPGAWLISSAGPSSADELPYASALVNAAQKHQWPLRLGLLHQAGPEAPGIAELLTLSEAVLLTSIQEGFGLPYLEAAAAGRPLIARAVPNVVPDLKQFGFRLPQLYADILIHPALIPWAEEHHRQEQLFHRWRAQLPRAYQAEVKPPALLAARGHPRPIPFSRLTLTGQLAVLAQPDERSWTLCAPFNPWLWDWKTRAETGGLEIAPWPHGADQWLSGQTYARKFAQMARHLPDTDLPPDRNLEAQADFIANKLKSKNLFPLLWANET